MAAQPITRADSDESRWQAGQRVLPDRYRGAAEHCVELFVAVQKFNNDQLDEPPKDFPLGQFGKRPSGSLESRTREF